MGLFTLFRMRSLHSIPHATPSSTAVRMTHFVDARAPIPELHLASESEGYHRLGLSSFLRVPVTIPASWSGSVGGSSKASSSHEAPCGDEFCCMESKQVPKVVEEGGPLHLNVVVLYIKKDAERLIEEGYQKITALLARRWRGKGDVRMTKAMAIP